MVKTHKLFFHFLIIGFSFLFLFSCEGSNGSIEDLSRPTSPAFSRTVNQATFSWRGVDNAIGYNVYQKRSDLSPTAIDSSFTKLNEAIVTTNEYIFPLPQTGVYTFGASAVQSDLSETALGTQLTVEIDFLERPNRPTSVAATTTEDPLAVNLTWANGGSTGTSGVNIYRALTSSPDAKTKLNTALITGTSYTDSTVESLTDYSYTITSVDASDVESFSSFPATTIIAPVSSSALTAAGAMTLTAATFSAENQEITLSWTGSDTFNAVPIEISRTGTVTLDTEETAITTVLYTQTSESATSYVDTQIVPGYSYTYKIRPKRESLPDLSYSNELSTSTHLGQLHLTTQAEGYAQYNSLAELASNTPASQRVIRKTALASFAGKTNVIKSEGLLGLLSDDGNSLASVTYYVDYHYADETGNYTYSHSQDSFSQQFPAPLTAGTYDSQDMIISYRELSGTNDQLTEISPREGNTAVDHSMVIKGVDTGGESILYLSFGAVVLYIETYTNSIVDFVSVYDTTYTFEDFAALAQEKPVITDISKTDLGDGNTRFTATYTAPVTHDALDLTIIQDGVTSSANVTDVNGSTVDILTVATDALPTSITLEIVGLLHSTHNDGSDGILISATLSTDTSDSFTVSVSDL